MAKVTIQQEFQGSAPELKLFENWGLSRSYQSQLRRGWAPISLSRALKDSNIEDIPDWMGEAVVSQALAYAACQHQDQVRKNGTPYIGHLRRVVGTLQGWGLPWWVCAAGALHDVIEDCGVQPFELDTLFGPTITALVEAVTERVGSEGQQDKEEYFARWGEWAQSNPVDHPVLWLPIADKLDNGRSFLMDAGGDVSLISVKWRGRFEFMDECVVTPFLDRAPLAWEFAAKSARYEWEAMIKAML